MVLGLSDAVSAGLAVGSSPLAGIHAARSLGLAEKEAKSRIARMDRLNQILDELFGEVAKAQGDGTLPPPTPPSVSDSGFVGPPAELAGAAAAISQGLGPEIGPVVGPMPGPFSQPAPSIREQALTNFIKNTGIEPREVREFGRQSVVGPLDSLDNTVGSLLSGRPSVETLILENMLVAARDRAGQSVDSLGRVARPLADIAGSVAGRFFGGDDDDEDEIRIEELEALLEQMRANLGGRPSFLTKNLERELKKLRAALGED